MQFELLATIILAGTALASPFSPNPVPGTCKAPRCTAHCADGFPYDCCVVYVRDPCTGHYGTKCTGPNDYNCVCYCPDGQTKFLCNANYFVDPCKKFDTTTSAV